MIDYFHLTSRVYRKLHDSTIALVTVYQYQEEVREPVWIVDREIIQILTLGRLYKC